MHSERQWRLSRVNRGWPELPAVLRALTELPEIRLSPASASLSRDSLALPATEFKGLDFPAVTFSEPDCLAAMRFVDQRGSE